MALDEGKRENQPTGGDTQMPQGLPQPPEQSQVEKLKAEMEECERERSQFKSMAQRIQADFLNYKRRSEEEGKELQKEAGTALILKMLPVLDDMNLALSQAPQGSAAGSWLEGVKLVIRKLQAVLEGEGLTRIEALGKEFNPWEHEVTFYRESSDHPEGQVIAVVREGYKMRGKVLRTAQVGIAKAAESERRSSGQGN